jgi:hypothetical protein
LEADQKNIKKMSRATSGVVKFIDDQARERFYSGEVHELICNWPFAELPNLPDSLKILHIKNNSKLVKLPKLPDGLQELYCSDCPELKKIVEIARIVDRP